MTLKKTDEQVAIIDYVVGNEGMLLVGAGAGNGKTYIGEEIIKAIKPSTSLYTAFNKAIVVEGRAKFDKYGTECKTFHALAYKYVQPGRDIQDLTYSCITENVTYKEKYEVIDAINDFFISSSEDMYDYMDEAFKDKPSKYKELAIKYIDKMINKEIKPSFNFILKYFHLMLVEGTVELNYDLAILDEINDTTGVALEIFKLIKAKRKIGLGETHQAIYYFMNLVDGFKELKGAPLLPLTQSFRCSTRIAASIQKFMRDHVTDEFTFIGTDNPVQNGNTLYVTRTNSSIVDHIVSMQRSGLGYTLLRDCKEIFSCPLSVLGASSGRKVYHPKYKFLETEYKNFKDSESKNYLSYIAEHVDDKEIQGAVNLLRSLSSRGINIFDVYSRAKDEAKNPDNRRTISTVFTAKGLEFETVYMHSDLSSAIQKILDSGGIQSDEDLAEFRCYYVAASRAGKNLHGATHLN